MVALQDQFLKSLIERSKHTQITEVIQTFPGPLAAQCRSLPDTGGRAPELFLEGSKYLLKEIHPSWYENLVEGCPKELQEVMLCAIRHYSGKISSQETVALSPAVQNFLLHYFLQHWPEAYIEGQDRIESDFQWLLSCNTDTILRLAELLSVDAVVDIVRQTVDKKILRKILTPFTTLQQSYLRSCLHRSIRSAALNKELTALLLKNPKEAHDTLLQKGLEDIGIAIQNEPSLLIWHIFHRIDRQIADMLKTMMSNEVSLKNHKAIQKRLNQAYQFLQKVKTT